MSITSWIEGLIDEAVTKAVSELTADIAQPNGLFVQSIAVALAENLKNDEQWVAQLASAVTNNVQALITNSLQPVGAVLTNLPQTIEAAITGQLTTQFANLPTTIAQAIQHLLPFGEHE